MKEVTVKADEARRWLSELSLAKKEDKKWVTRAKKIVKRYRDERGEWGSRDKKYNILWSNIQTMLPALYGKTPRADVQRRFKDQDPVGRTAAMILERSLQYEIDQYGTFDSAVKNAVLDRLLPGRGTVWVRFETKEIAEAEITENVQSELPDYEYECTPEDYVFWEDFRCSPARTWDEVTWVSRRVYMTREDGVKRFGEDFKEVPLTHEPIGTDELKNNAAEYEDIGDLKKAQVWEIWHKPSEMVYWVAEGYSKLLDEKEDPFGLDNFWPCPRPLFSTQTTDTIVPVPDYAQYQDQAQEIDRLTQRIDELTQAVKVVGVYDSSQPSIARMLNEGTNNTLIPVDQWAVFGEKGGLKGTVDFLPLDMVIKALQECYVAREAAKQVVYEVTGLSDIIRGASNASETATAQQIKSQYASLRLRRMQTEVAQFATEILRIKAQLMCDLYAPESLIQMSGIMGTQDAQYAEQAVHLLKSEPSRSFRIEVASDSLVEMDEQTEKQSRMEFLQATGAFMQQALPVVQSVPDLTPLVAEMLLFGVRAFKGGRTMEAAFDTAMAQLSAPKEPQAPPPDPEMLKIQAQQQIEQGRMQLEGAKTQATQQLEQVKLESMAQMEQFKQQAETEREALRMQHETQLEQLKQQAETERAQMKAMIDQETKLQIAGMTAAAAEKPAVQMNTDNMGKEVSGMVEQGSNAIAEAMTALTEAVAQMNRPKRRVIERDPNGKAVGMIEIAED